MRRFSVAVSAFALFFFAFALAPDSFAQEPPPQPPAPEVDLDEEDIQQVAEAYVAIEEVRQQYEAEFQQMDDPEAAQELQMEMQEEINAVIEDMEGMTLEEYDQAVQAAQQDEELRNQLLQAIEEEQGDDAPTQQPPQN